MYLCRRVLVALYLAQRLVGSIQNELRRVVAKEALTHVHNGLDRRCLRGLIDDRPNSQSVCVTVVLDRSPCRMTVLTKHPASGQRLALRA